MATSNLPETQASGVLSVETIKRRSVGGVLALTSRTFILQAINFTSLTFFTILFTQAEYGIYGIVLAIRGFLSYFSDIGLAAALIQKKEKVTRTELKTTFLVQQLLVMGIVIVGFAVTPFLAKWQQLTQNGIYLLWSFYIAFFLSSLKTIPSVLLERKLEFTKLVIPQILEAVVFSAVAIFLAFGGFGILSLAYAVLAQSIVGTVAMYILKPWRPGFAFSTTSLKGLFKFGIPYQLNTFVSVIKDDGLTIFLGGLLGPVGIGYMLWAKKWGEAPLRFFMDQVIKVTFPAFSRLQDDRVNLASAVSRSIFFISLLVFPSIVGLVLFAPTLTEIIPKYEKWQPALLALALFGAHAAFAAVATPITNLFNAIGKINITFKLTIAWTVLSWLLIPYFAARYGFTGVAVAVLLIETVSVFAIWLGYKLVKFDLLYSVGKPLIATMIMGAVLKFIQPQFPESLTGIISLTVIGVVLYALLMLILVGKTLIIDIRKVVYATFKK